MLRVNPAIGQYRDAPGSSRRGLDAVAHMVQSGDECGNVGLRIDGIGCVEHIKTFQWRDGLLTQPQHLQLAKNRRVHHNLLRGSARPVRLRAERHANVMLSDSRMESSGGLVT